MKKYILYAGVNGAGKSTLYQTNHAPTDIYRINTDEILKEFGDWRNPADLMKAGKIAVQRLNEYFKMEYRSIRKQLSAVIPFLKAYREQKQKVM